jgi:hypothetical protein
MSFAPKTPKDDHFVSNPDLDILSHRPHKGAALLYNAMTATAVFTIWPHLLFFAGWSAMVCCVNKFTNVELVVPNTLLTALGEPFPRIREDRADFDRSAARFDA